MLQCMNLQSHWNLWSCILKKLLKACLFKSQSHNWTTKTWQSISYNNNLVESFLIMVIGQGKDHCDVVERLPRLRGYQKGRDTKMIRWIILSAKCAYGHLYLLYLYILNISTLVFLLVSWPLITAWWCFGALKEHVNIMDVHSFLLTLAVCQAYIPWSTLSR